MTKLNCFKMEMVNEMFVEPADNNYVLARWLFVNGIVPEYCWQAAQAIEKYQKAILLLNKERITKQHEIGKDLARVRKTAGDLVPADLLAHIGASAKGRSKCTPEHFISRVERQGHPDCRYGQVSWSIYGNDILALDCLVFHLRRLAVGLDWKIDPDWQTLGDWANHRGLTYRAALTAHPELEVHSWKNLEDPLDMVVTRRMEMRDYWNVYFGDAEIEGKRRFSGILRSDFGGMENKRIHLYLRRIQTKGRDTEEHILNGMKWILDNKLIPDKERDLLKEALNAAGK